MEIINNILVFKMIVAVPVVALLLAIVFHRTKQVQKPVTRIAPRKPVVARKVITPRYIKYGRYEF